MSKKAIERLAGAIGYPERIPEGAASFPFRADGAEIASVESDGCIRLEYALSDDETMLPTLAAYAAGRMLKEDAILSYGDGRAFLWQDAPADADARELLRLFETFMDSLDWWRERVEDRKSRVESRANEEATMVIRP